MRRTIFLAVLATLLLVPTARAASTTQILRDCTDDSVLEGHYSLSDLRKAKSALSGDISEYSDCGDVLSRAIASASQSQTPSTHSGSGGGGVSGGGGGGSTGGGGSSSPHTSHQPSQTDQDFVVGAATPKDHAAVNDAATKGGGPVTVAGRSIDPNARLAASFGRNGLPTTLIVALVLLALAALAATAPLVRRRVLAHRHP
jgi:hypothetical protein